MDPKTALLVAGIGLLGVLIGGIITAGANFILAVRRENIEKARDRDLKAKEIKKAARLVAQELRISWGLVSLALEQKKPWPPREVFKTGMWQAYGATLSAELLFSQWNTVVKAYEAVIRIPTNSPASVELSEDNVRVLSNIARQISEGITSLGPYIDIHDLST